MVAVFFAAFAFFGAIVFLPRWLQVVQGFSPTNSGLAALPLMVGLIASSIVSGLIVVPDRALQVPHRRLGHRDGLRGVPHDRPHQGHADAVVWLWMFLAGIGVGPTFSVPTIVIQNAVPFRQLGVATSNLTFFRQIGGTIALAFVGTIFGTTFSDSWSADRRRRRSAAGDRGLRAAAPRHFDLSPLTGIGDIGRRSCRGAPAVPGAHRAGDPAHCRRHPRGVQPRDRPDVLARRRRGRVATVAALAIKEIPLRAQRQPVRSVRRVGGLRRRPPRPRGPPAAKPAPSAD